MSEKTKDTSVRLAGWKRLILILVPFLLFIASFGFMILAIIAHGPDFTRNHGDAALTMCLISALLLFAGIAMQFVWPKAINKGKAVVKVGLVFNIILAVGSIIPVAIGYAMKDKTNKELESSYTSLNDRVLAAKNYESNAKTKITSESSYTVNEFVDELSSMFETAGGKRAIRHTGSKYSVDEYERSVYSTYKSTKPVGSYVYTDSGNFACALYSVYIGDEALMKEFIAKYQLTEFTYKEDYKLKHAPLWYEAQYTDGIYGYDAHFDFGAEVLTELTMKNHTASMTGYTVLFDLNAKAARILWEHVTDTY